MGSPIDPAIQRLLDGWLEAVQAGDVAAIVRHYSDDVLVHEHFSIPFDMHTGQLLFDAQP